MLTRRPWENPSRDAVKNHPVFTGQISSKNYNDQITIQTINVLQIRNSYGRSIVLGACCKMPESYTSRRKYIEKPKLLVFAWNNAISQSSCRCIQLCSAAPKHIRHSCQLWNLISISWLASFGKFAINAIPSNTCLLHRWVINNSAFQTP